MNDHIVNLTKALTAGLPVIGGPLSSLIGDYVPTSSRLNEAKFLECLSEKVEKLGERITLTKIDKREFSELFKECYFIALKASRDQKINACANILANNLLDSPDNKKLHFDELELYAKVLDNISFGAVSILKEIVDMSPKSNSFGWETLSFGRVLGEIRKKQDIDSSLTFALVSELSIYKFIILEPGSYRSPTNAAYKVTLTDLGVRFVGVIMET